jgi:RHS repeat-associated protein
VGLTTHAEYDYRVMQPRLVTDPNDNRSAFSFTPLGLLEAAAVMGKAGETVGDTLAEPSTQLQYDFLAFEDRSQPISVRTIRRVDHFNDPGASDDTIETVEYSDGFGRLLQTRTQAEDVLFGDRVFGGNVLPEDQSDEPGTRQDVVGRENLDHTRPNVVVSGWQIYNNKGWVIEKFEPFYSTGWDYAQPSDDERGQKATMFYDPRGQVIRTLNPDESEQIVIYGVPMDLTNPENFTPTPWEAYTYDANDNAERTHGEATRSYETHWNTPASAVVDALGRTVETVARNGANPTTDWFRTLSTYDIRGNLLTVTDALGRLNFTYVYDLANRPWRIENIDAGIRRIVLDAVGNEIERRDSKDALILQAYDVLNRPIRFWARDQAGEAMTLRQQLEYGDGSDPAQPVAERETNRNLNRLGKLHQHYDEAGRLTFESYDFKANLLEKFREVIRDDEILYVFNSTPIVAYRVNWQPPAGTSLADHASRLLDGREYHTSTTYDALNRIKTLQYPLDEDNERKMLQPTYNLAGALERVELDGTTYVEHIAYNAKGQRTLIAYGNDVMTRYAYDPQTFRLKRMRTERYESPADYTYHPSAPSQPLQELGYSYDLSGNILRIVDRTLGSGVQDNPEAALFPDIATLVVAGNALVRRFAYDPLNRLVSATGRECNNIPAPRPWTDDPRCGANSGDHGTPNQGNAPNMTQIYRENYSYDPAGNMLTMGHYNNGHSWTRHFGMGGLWPDRWQAQWPLHLGAEEWPDAPGNKLTHVGDNAPTTPQTHFFDINGNLIRENTERHFEWDHSDRMRVFRNQVDGSEPSVHAHYLYDAGGQRVKKLVRKQNGDYDVTHYIDGIFEHHHWEGNEIGDNNHLHVMDNQQRIALVRVGLAHPDDRGPATQFHLGDHLSSSNLVIGEDGAWINREEYTPYGETSFGSFAKKRYHFTGKELDEESRLYYYEARYYTPWLCRWISCDPIGLTGGLNLYTFVGNNSLNRVDTTGKCFDEMWRGLKEGVLNRSPGIFLGFDIARAITGEVPLDRTVAAYVIGPGAAVTELARDPGAVGRHLIIVDDLDAIRQAIASGNTQEVTRRLTELGIDAGTVLLAERVLGGGEGSGGGGRGGGGRGRPSAESSNQGGGAPAEPPPTGNTPPAPPTGAGAATPRPSTPPPAGGTPSAPPAGAGAPASPSTSASGSRGTGTLTPAERAELQQIADRHNAQIDVVGSRAAGEGRNIDTNLPVGKGPATRSDIDVRISGEADIASRGRLSHDISNVSGGAGNIVSSGLPQIPSRPPVISITPTSPK